MSARPNHALYQFHDEELTTPSTRSLYRVEWSVDVEAEDAKDAAQQARRLQQWPREGYWVGLFRVAQHPHPDEDEWPEEVTIDLDEEEQDQEDDGEDMVTLATLWPANHPALAVPVPPKLDSRQLATVLAALRYWQRQGLTSEDNHTWEIATNAGEFEPLTEEEIDDLCERLNT